MKAGHRSRSLRACRPEEPCNHGRPSCTPSRHPPAPSSTPPPRRPSRDEAAALHLPPTATVLVRDTTTACATTTSETPIDHTRSVWPAEFTTLTSQRRW